jgi:signal transduction histidine kinase
VPYSRLVGAIGGDRIFFVPAFPGAQLFQPIPKLPKSTINAKQLERNGVTTLDLTYKGTHYVAVAQPEKLGTQLFGALVVAKPTSQLRSRWITLVERLAVAFGGGLIVAGLLGVYLSRRIAEPLRRLSQAADEVAAGHYGVELPRPYGDDEISHLSARFSDMAAKLAESEQLSRNFLMSVSHELRTPLTAIRGHVAALHEGVIDDPGLREASLGVIEEEAMRLERLVGDVLDLAKLDAHRFTLLQEEVDMEQLCERAYATFGEVARLRSIDYRREILAHPVIVTDGDRVLQIISNLLSNAFRWTPEGGRVELALSAENGAVSVVVADTGPGITEEERDRIFRPFWSRDGGGTGLGLAIARELALALGGRIELESEPGRGSRFELVLPST